MDYRDAEEDSKIVYDEATIAALETFFENMHALQSGEDGPDKEDGAERLYREASDLNYAQGMLLALVGRYTSEIGRDAMRESLSTFMRIVELTNSRFDEIEPEMRQLVLHLYLGAIVAMIEVPQIPIDRIDSVLNHMERTHQIEGAPMGTVELSRSAWAAETGDRSSALEHLEAFLVEPEGWKSVTQLKLGLSTYACIDRPVEGLQFADDRIDRADLDDEDRIYIDGMRCGLMVWAGSTARAAETARALLDEFELEELHTYLGIEYVALALLEDRPTVRRLLDWSASDPPVEGSAGETRILALHARLCLAEPATIALGEEYRAKALANAARFDARNGTSYHSDLMRRQWLGESIA